MKKTSFKLSAAEISAEMGKMVNAKTRFSNSHYVLRHQFRHEQQVQSSSLEWGEGWYKLLGEPLPPAVLRSPTDACGLVAYPVCTFIIVSARGHQQCLSLSCGKESIQFCVKQRAHSPYSWHQLPGVTQGELFPSSPLVCKCSFLNYHCILDVQENSFLRKLSQGLQPGSLQYLFTEHY